MKNLKLSSVCILFTISMYSQQTNWLTDYEKSGRTETPRYKETLDYCRRLDSASSLITFISFGKSAQGQDLPLLIMDKEGLSDPEKIHDSGRLLLLIQACIHPGECEGKDAGLMLFRDLMLNQQSSASSYPLSGLLDHVSIIFIPIFNADGHERFGPYNRINQNGPKEMGWRVTANNLNLNRDFLKADTPEMQAWLKMFNNWMPDFFIDTHTTDGADYQYVLTYLMEIYGDMDQPLTDWSKEVLIPEMKKKMEQTGFPVFPYVDFRRWHDPRSGLITEVAPPMLSQGYTALRNRPGLLIETHMLKPYQLRVNATYQCILACLETLNHENVNLRMLITKADQFVSGEEFLQLPFPLRFETLKSDSLMTDFKGVEYTEEKSAISGGSWFKYSSIPANFKLPYFCRSEVTDSTRLPYAYIIPAEWKTVVDRIRIHGIRVRTLNKATIISITTFRFKNPKWQVNPYEGRHAMTNIEYDEIIENRWFPAGSVIVEVMQPAGRIIPHMLEPRGNGSYLYWGFFDAIFEQKEYAESYVLEKMASEMLAVNPDLQMEFEIKKSADTAFAKNPQSILNWFYSKSPYIDNRKGIYPVGKIFNREILNSLPCK